MAQSSDTSINSGLSGLAVRNAINENLAALFSGSSGSTAPSSPVGGQPWLDNGVSPPVHRLRNNANTAWLPLLPETVPANTLRGNPTGSAAAIGEVSMTQLRAMMGFGQSLGAGSGYVQLPGGVIHQWVTTGAAGSGSNGAVSFPTTFPTACVGIWLQYANTGNDSAVGDNFLAQVRAYTTSGFTIRNLGPSAAVFFVLAMGY